MNDRTRARHQSPRHHSPRHHSLSAEQFTAIARGGGGPDAIGRLVAAQRSKHLILLGKVAELARRGDRPDDALGVAGYRLLARVQRRDPAAAEEVIGYPSVGAWALHVIRADGTPTGDAPASGAQAGGTRAGGTRAEPRPSGLAAIAAAAAIRAGLDFEIEVPVTDGAVLLPSLGAADAVGGTAIVSARAAEARAGENWAGGAPAGEAQSAKIRSDEIGAGEGPAGEIRAAEVRSGDLRVTARPGAAGWREIRSAAAGSLHVLIDDLDPFRMPVSANEPPPTGRLTLPQLAELRAALAEAWPLLPAASAEEIAAIVRVIVPYTAPEFGHASTSSSQTFGAVAISRLPDKYTCAETLLHETQHVKLCALLDLVALTRPDDGRRYYAPWRDDPRPASGLLQGAYAFLGVSGFWREQRQAAPEPEVRQRAHAEFARWRDGAAAVAQTLLGSGQLTGPGETFVVTMAGVLDDWRREPVPSDALAIARGKADRHLSRWRADNG